MLSSSADVPPPPATGLEVRPFRALTYREHDPEHLARVSSPAYDLVTPAGRESLAAADPHNIVRLILPRVEPASGAAGALDQGRTAEAAGATLREWQAAGVLARDEQPALWLYELRPPDGGPVTRGWLGAVALPPPGSRAVLPHEDTYPRAVEGRRALLDATRTDLEPIVLAHDPEPELDRLTDQAVGSTPGLEVTDEDGVRHRLWRVTEPALLDQVTGALRRTGAVIADGHHRFAAAQAHHRQRPERGGSDAVLALVTPMGPGGLRVEPIHRVVPDLDFDAAVAAASAGFSVAEVVPETGAAGLDGSPDPGLQVAVERWVHDSDDRAWLISDGRRLAVLREPTPEALATVPPEAPTAWRELDVVLAHRALVEHLWHRSDDPGSVLVAHDVPEALRTAAARDGVAVLLRPPASSAVAAVARAGARMPRKSTLFVPKPRTGLVLRPHED